LKERSETTQAPVRSGAAAATRSSPIEWLRWVPAIVFSLLVVSLLLIGASVIFLPFLCSLALAYLLAPGVRWFEQRGWSRATSVTLTMTLAALLSVLALIFILPGIWEQLGNSYRQMIELLANRQKATPLLSKLKQVIPPVYAEYIDLLAERVEAAIRQTNLSELALNWLQSGLFQLVHLTASLFDLLLIPLFVYYLLADSRTIRTRLELLIPPRFRPQALALINQISLVMSSYVRGQLLVALLMSLLYVLGFIALRVPLALMLGLLAGLLNFIPYFGTLTGLSFSLLFLILDGAGIARLLGLIAVFAIVQGIEGYYLTPKLLGHRLNLSPLWVLVGLLIGGNLFGLIGIVLALPILAIAKVLLGFIEEIYQESDFYSRSSSTLLTGDGQPVEASSGLKATSIILLATQRDETQSRTIVTSSELASRTQKRPPDS
jgi:predicted PurR-regulated permease PerM